MLFDFKFKSFFYKNDRKQPDLWSFFLNFVCKTPGLAIFWTLIWLLSRRPDNQNEAFVLKFNQIKIFLLKYQGCLAAEKPTILRIKNQNGDIWKQSGDHVGISQEQLTGNTVKVQFQRFDLKCHIWVTL